MSQFAGFNSVQMKKPSKSAFDLSHQKRLSTRMGRLTPVLMLEAVPSDTFRGSSEILMRLAPLLAPIYDQILLYVHFFFVPNRLIWEDWEEFITGGRLGVGIDPVNAPVPPFFNIGDMLDNDPATMGPGTLADYLGLPNFIANDPTLPNWNDANCDLMPFLAYQICWYEYYRDRNFVADTVQDFPMVSGLRNNADIAPYVLIQSRLYAHDYFTSALPFTQRGEEVLLPLTGSGSVTYLDRSRFLQDDGANIPGGFANAGVSGGGNPSELFWSNGAALQDGARIENIDEVQITASGTSINDFRSAYALQVWLERNAVGGSRYTESTQAHFGVKPQDSRLQRPEYIGGGRIPVKISEVVSTSWANDGTNEVPQANMAGHGVTYGNTNQFSYFCTEHGFIVGIASIMAPATYQQGLPRMFRRRSFLDYPWPTFAKLGEQAVNDYELFTTGASLTEDADGEFPLFGYQSRYADWKYICNSNHGDFRTTLNFWSLTRIFADAPVLSEEFLSWDGATEDQIFATSTADHFWLYVHNQVNVRRPLPYFGTPNNLGFS